MGISAVTFVVLRCADIERARTFYEALGLTLQSERHGSGPRHYSTLIGQTVVELYPETTEQSTLGIRLGMRVTDIAEILNAVKGIGGTVLRANLESLPPSIVLRDFDGHKLELVQETDVAPPSRKKR